ncbi:PREDICTED: E3 ubiquitin-protein ligase RBBP6-like [Cariama cristata]|uniref:E3 ubiquitin-protein ligase RBBP6-like n=1 Tax=Cariama cristata TaxID=54380 RepID=UPI0005202F34|nr:PREDICTED: E3 ubiquitin-protein ligase RBBP6-like [Cariama cristata]
MGDLVTPQRAMNSCAVTQHYDVELSERMWSSLVELRVQSLAGRGAAPCNLLQNYHNPQFGTGVANSYLFMEPLFLLYPDCFAEYTDDTALIPKNSSVIVRRIPIGGVKATSKTYVMTPKSHKILETAFRSRTEPVSGTSKAIDDSSASISLAQLTKTANLAEANASEEDKIKAMMTQSGHEYDPINYMKKPLGPPPPSYTCFRCGKPGHYIKNCPTNGDKNFESVPRIKKSTGIPRSFMMEVKDPNTKGAMLTNTGKYAIPTIDA